MENLNNLKLTKHINTRLTKLGYDELAFDGGREWPTDCLMQNEINFEYLVLSDCNIRKLAKRFYVGYAREAMMNSISKLSFSIDRNKVTYEEACVEPGLSCYEEVVCNDFMDKINAEIRTLATQLIVEGNSLLN